MNILKKIFGKTGAHIFIDGQTYFILSTDEKESHTPTFQNIECRLIKTIKQRGEKWYLIEIKENYSGVDFGIEAIPVKNFFIRPRRTSHFGKKDKNDVIVVLPDDVNNPMNMNRPLSSMKVIDWAYISAIQN